MMDDHSDRISYRQVGRRAGGRLARGPAGRGQRPGSTSGGSRGEGASVERDRAKATIPSRFETVLHHGPTESDGFGSASQRFRYAENSAPGPGAYGKDSQASTFVWNPELKGSISKKGYGGLVSKTNRFSNRAMLEAANMPGPGGSRKRPPKSMLFSRTDFSRGTVSANFARPRRYRDEPVVDDNRIPGPGSYASHKAKGSAMAGCASGFRSKTSRFKYELGVPFVGPGPGAHNVEGAVRFKQAQGRSSGPQSSFRSQSKRGKQMILSKGIPGPGSYHANVSADEAAKQKQALNNLLSKAPVGGIRVLGQKQRRLISEQKRDGLHFGSLGSDRFGKPYARKTTQDPVPGPGAYGNHTQDTRPRALASSSAFLSETKRGIDAQLGGGGGKPPGPAFYRPRLKMKKSFMLNAAKKWV
eukprot:g428.t1